MSAAFRVARPGLAAALLALLVAAAAGLQWRRDQAYEAFRAEPRMLYVSSGAALQRMALSFDTLLADVYWIRALQHYGRAGRAGGAAGRCELLYPLLDVATTLDPRFDVVYRFGAIFLAEGCPGAAGRPDLALALLRKGMRARPERWQYLQDAGFVHYWWLNDYAGAAHWFQRASEMPGAAWWLRSLAADTLARGGDRDGARTLWREMDQAFDNAWLRAEARRRLMQLDALDAIDTYTQAVARFTRRAGGPPSVWTELLADGEDEPRDPAGHPYVFDRRTGAVSVARDSPLFPLPAVPRATVPR